MRFAAAIAVLVSVLIPLSAAAASVRGGSPAKHPATASADGLWTDISEREILARGTGARMIVPRLARTITLNVAAFLDMAGNAPSEFTGGAETLAPVIALPMPDGTFQRFAIQESPVIDASLAARLPNIHTYRGAGLDDPTASARLDFTAEGFHGFILSPSGTVYIDPYRRGDTTHYMSYFRRDYERPAGTPPFHCDTTSERVSSAMRALSNQRSATSLATSGPTLRTYRLALACTGEYAAYYGGTVTGAQNGMITTINRVDGIYERELAIRLTMVDNTSVVFTNAATDPYANTSDDLDANQATLDANIGNANYDIGHLFGTGGGGVADLGVVCISSYKGQGLTGSSAPIGDAFDVDYVAHEMGHQFGADHTFNGTSNACGGGNRAAAEAYEPGSGSTIMAYAGICSPENLQPHSDPYFHGKSFDEIIAYVTTYATCAVQTASGNSAPVPSAGSAVNIPASTPFFLTGSATDPNGDPLTYCWEEFDLGNPGPPNTDDGSRPIFRSFLPSTSPTRVFPKLADILAGTSTFGESLPTTTRAMTFRLTARDNKAGGGGVASATTTVNVTGAAGPFTVTAPSTAVSWSAGSTQTVTWNVAGTTAAPVSCANVAIFLSTDGGNTFPTTIVASTANDGTEAVTIPNAPTSTARIKIACTSSPFFNISRPNFTIAASSGGPSSLTAQATGPTTVHVSWSGTVAADTYEVYRAASGLVFSRVLNMPLTVGQIGNIGTVSWDDTTVAGGTAYLYYVRALTGGAPSAASPEDLATTVIFTDDSLVAGTTPVKATHLAELRTAVDAVHVLAGLGHVTFTDTAASGLTIKSIHFTEIRTALTDARAALSLTAMSYTNSASAGTPVRASDVTELRNGVK